LPNLIGYCRCLAPCTKLSFKAYPTFDQLGTKFDLTRSKAHQQLYELAALLHETLIQLGMMPQREFQCVADLIKALDGIDELIVDAVASRGSPAYQRPQDVQQ